ncbi:Helix-turn-helix [Amphibacillus marinus]|uniref:Helix-turn-helix n=1 Tax=Amphibacillus marinus TaxID=872970 RepID=A0A1H8SPK3_9BACI|nr:helix-turn-helix transcriptional regulator [Amphibacillus marinus]SEO80879.1 Helix-turn-helix [Amphibacillus marinus]
MNNIGEQIKILRKSRGLTQAYVSKKLGYKSASMISEIESGKKGLDANKVPLIAAILNVHISELYQDFKILEKRNLNETA